QVAAARCLPAALAPLCTRRTYGALCFMMQEVNLLRSDTRTSCPTVARSLQCRAGASLAHAGTLEIAAVLQLCWRRSGAALARADRCSAALALLWHTQGRLRSLQCCSCAGAARALWHTQIAAVLRWRLSGTRRDA
ncbi:unnamed protein product, partial [Effrenium voratum]